MIGLQENGRLVLEQDLDLTSAGGANGNRPLNGGLNIGAYASSGTSSSATVSGSFNAKFNVLGFFANNDQTLTLDQTALTIGGSGAMQGVFSVASGGGDSNIGTAGRIFTISGTNGGTMRVLSSATSSFNTSGTAASANVGAELRVASGATLINNALWTNKSYSSNVTYTGLTVAAGATLSGTGHFDMAATGTGALSAKNTSISGTIAPGDGGLGTLTISTGTISFNNGSMFRVKTDATGSDMLAINGAANVLSGANISFSGSTGLGNYTLATASSGLNSGTFTGSAPIDYRLFYSGTALNLTRRATIGAINATPEAAIIVGGTTNVSITVGNSAPVNSSNLAFTIAAGGNMGGSASGNVVALGTGTSTGLRFTSNSAGAARSGTFTVTDADATNSGQPGTVNVDVYDHASASLSGTTLALGNIHQGYQSAVTSSTVSALNGSGFRVNLRGSAASNGNLSLGSISGIAAGNSGSIVATLATGQGAGSINQAFTYTFADDSALSGASANVGTQSLNIIGQVYTGAGVWNKAGGGSYGSLSNMSNWVLAGGAPGLDSGFTSSDTATFGSGGSGTVTLDGATPSLKAITFDNSSSYTLAKGSGGRLRLNDLTGTANVLSQSGTHAISADIALDADMAANVSGSSRLVVSGSISGANKRLTKSGSGTLALSGTSDYSGATTVDAGLLEVDGSIASSVTVESGGTLGGHGSLGALTVKDGGIISPGNSPGALTVDSGTFFNGSTFRLELASSGTGTAGVNWDQLNVTGQLDLSNVSAGGIHLSLVNYGFEWNSSKNDRWASFITYESIKGFNSNLFDIQTGAFGDTACWSVVEGTNGLDLQYLAVPEPSTWAMMLGGFGMLLMLQRARRRSE